MSARISLCIVGCGGMGERHIRALRALEDVKMSPFQIAGVCDLDQGRAVEAASLVRELFGHDPRVFGSIQDAVAAEPRIDAFDVVTEVSSHLPVAREALTAERHVLCEKPLGLTVEQCLQLMEAAKTGGTVLATAENYRRDPPNRLVRAILEAELLGDVHLMVESILGGDDKIIISPWRHLKEQGAIGLDMGVHITDLMQYYFGPIHSAYGKSFIAEPTRHRREAPERNLSTYQRRFDEMPTQIEATGDDSLVALVEMDSGVLVQFSYVPSGPGHLYRRRTILGRKGSLEVPKDRTGEPMVLRRQDGEHRGVQILDLLPDFRLDPVTRALFGSKGVEYSLDPGLADAFHIAIELADFGDAISSGRPAEVDAELGMFAVAGVYAIAESQLLRRPVTISEVVSGEASGYAHSVLTPTG